MTIVYGTSVEPGGMELDYDKYETDCPECGAGARMHHWEACESGSINQYWSIHCEACGHADGEYGDSVDDCYTDYGWLAAVHEDCADDAADALPENPEASQLQSELDRLVTMCGW